MSRGAVPYVSASCPCELDFGNPGAGCDRGHGCRSIHFRCSTPAKYALNSMYQRVQVVSLGPAAQRKHHPHVPIA
eukprot:1137994-Pelagomonas_calceolata.AAC.5